MFKIFKPKRGSVLVLSLVIMFILLAAAITLATVSVRDRQSIMTTDKSNQALQVANSGVELVMRQIYKNTRSNLNSIASALGGGAACSNGVITKSDVAGGTVKVSFYDGDGDSISCSATDWRVRLVGVKSEGTASGTTRLIETAVAVASDYEWVTTDNGTQIGGGTNHSVRYNDATHAPDVQCQNAGYQVATGACKTNDNDLFTQGSLLYYFNRDTDYAYMTCHYRAGTYYHFDNDSTTKILCAK